MPQIAKGIILCLLVATTCHVASSADGEKVDSATSPNPTTEAHGKPEQTSMFIKRQVHLSNNSLHGLNKSEFKAPVGVIFRH
ncbi:hypothetical protein RvY_03101 [Ramazzottius varieornatus]|uniref:Uncharacterized protein n=1 Tax=Ramazzottius varieornatus TaxID=947166 RepID=A0A1D1UWF3_RAMVA|nr:hypothetical protein RvY_03101 [Ramazzottius varieornatus]